MIHILNSIPIKLIAIAVCGGLFSLGGFSFLAARRFIMPFILAIMVSTATNTWWTGLMVLPVIVTLSLGYKNFGQHNFARALWLMVQAVVIGIGLTLTGHLNWFLFIPYCITAAVLAGILNNRLPQIFGDLIFGGILASVLLLIH